MYFEKTTILSHYPVLVTHIEYTNIHTIYTCAYTYKVYTYNKTIYIILLLLFDTYPAAVVYSDATQGYYDVNSFYRDRVRTLTISLQLDLCTKGYTHTHDEQKDKIEG